MSVSYTNDTFKSLLLAVLAKVLVSYLFLSFSTLYLMYLAVLLYLMVFQASVSIRHS